MRGGRGGAGRGAARRGSVARHCTRHCSVCIPQAGPRCGRVGNGARFDGRVAPTPTALLLALRSKSPPPCRNSFHHASGRTAGRRLGAEGGGPHAHTPRAGRCVQTLLWRKGPAAAAPRTNDFYFFYFFEPVGLCPPAARTRALTACTAKTHTRARTAYTHTLRRSTDAAELFLREPF